MLNCHGRTRVFLWSRVCDGLKTKADGRCKITTNKFRSQGTTVTMAYEKISSSVSGVNLSSLRSDVCPRKAGKMTTKIAKKKKIVKGREHDVRKEETAQGLKSFFVRREPRGRVNFYQKTDRFADKSVPGVLGGGDKIYTGNPNYNLTSPPPTTHTHNICCIGVGIV